ncbi:hypothetical protein AR000_08545 [Listeria monocytogenes]|nr:hypothetical protein [Listeria monocytogenes]EAD1148877.1 hypothetical protein [Listeria monocytogenes]EAD4558511.1 hypothetical protein [Listeria monocytogenes]
MQIKTNEFIGILKNSRTRSLERIKALELNLFKYKQANTKPPKHLIERINRHKGMIDSIKTLEDELKQSENEFCKL